MILEKIKQHAEKILFLLTGVLLIIIGAIISKQKELDLAKENLSSNSGERALGQTEEAEKQVDISAVQENIENNRNQKTESVDNNPETVATEQTVPVTKTVPGTTSTVKVPETTSTKSSSTSKKSTSSTPTKTTKTS